MTIREPLSPMTDEIQEYWMKFCERAVKQPDPKELIELVRQINEELDAASRSPRMATCP